MGYQLFSDMTADVSEALMRGMPEVAYVPMQVELGGESFTYGPGSSLTVEQFYAEQRAGKFASTSQINPMIYRRCFEQALKAGEDVLYLSSPPACPARCNPPICARRNCARNTRRAG